VLAQTTAARLGAVSPVTPDDAKSPFRLRSADADDRSFLVEMARRVCSIILVRP
jgi:hypothetical protein